jgi:hypothetical protein
MCDSAESHFAEASLLRWSVILPNAIQLNVIQLSVILVNGLALLKCLPTECRTTRVCTGLTVVEMIEANTLAYHPKEKITTRKKTFYKIVDR